ncbi:MAG TPA: ferredoxin reductase [Pseudonocardia sp.]
MSTPVAERLRWRVARLLAARPETAAARTLVLEVPGWPGHLGGQHVDVRLTAEDGYSTQRSYSLADATEPGRVELTVQRVEDGEVSSYLADVMEAGDRLELRGPVGGWFVWRPEDTAPVLLVAGGSGIVPLRAMLRTRRAAGSRVPFRLIYSVRTPEDVIYADELRGADPGVEVTLVHTRRTPDRGLARPPSRIGVRDLVEAGWPPELAPTCYVCGPTGFVEAVADQLVLLGHEPERIRTERFGPS